MNSDPALSIVIYLDNSEVTLATELETGPRLPRTEAGVWCRCRVITHLSFIGINHYQIDFGFFGGRGI